MISGEERETFLDLYNNYRDSRSQAKAVSMVDGAVPFESGAVGPDIPALNTLAEVSRQHGHLPAPHSITASKQKGAMNLPLSNVQNGYEAGEFWELSGCFVNRN